MSEPLLPITTATLPQLAARGIAVPAYERSGLAPRIVHVGVGGFHRAHMALYTDELAAAGSDWGIRGLGLLTADAAMAAALGAQEHLYTLTEKDTDNRTTRVIGSIVDYRLAAADHAVAAATIADPDVAIVSLTITEAGYAEPESGEQTTCDVLAACLDQRRLNGAAPLTMLSCDNLPGNGDVSRRAILAAASRRSAALAEWVEQHCAFPNSMVDRITPATAEADREWLRSRFGVDDRWPVVGEPFRQWVIEDHFAAGRPKWEDAGALFTSDVHAWERYKLRFLNAGHSCIAYLSALAGIVYVDEAMATPQVRRFIEELLYREALPTVPEIPGHRREDYIATVLHRFTNLGVRDQIARLCIDGTAKYPTFLIPTLAGQLERNGPIRCAVLALAGWARYLATVPVDEQAFDASGDAARAAGADALNDPVAFLNYDRVFPAQVRDHPRMRAEFTAAWKELDQRGPLGAMMGASADED